MEKNALLLLAVLWIIPSGFDTTSSRDYFLDYIEQYKAIAIREMQRTGIPASIKLAQALQESGAGTSELARQANNHFGIKCSNDWLGQTYYRKDDDYNVQGELIESCFRVYQSAEQSFVEHSEFLKKPRYSALFQLPPSDYRAWAQGLLQAGYATDRLYATRLIDLIERYQLYQYDGIDNNNSNTTVPLPPIADAGYRLQNDVKYVYAHPNESLEAIANRTAIPIPKLLQYNDNFQGAYQKLDETTRIYIQPKRDYYRGSQKYHIVQHGETMFDIAQAYAIKLDKLYERNRMQYSTQPAPKEKIKLRGSKVRESPRLRKQETPLAEENPDYLFEEPLSPVINPSIDNSSTHADENFDEEDRLEQTEIFIPLPIPTPEALYHIVQQGDTLWNISQRYGTTVEQLKKLNNLNSNLIRVGMQVRVQ